MMFILLTSVDELVERQLDPASVTLR